MIVAPSKQRFVNGSARLLDDSFTTLQLEDEFSLEDPQPLTAGREALLRKHNRDIGRLAFAIALLILSSLCNDVALAFIHERVPDTRTPLPDLWFSLFPEYTPAQRFSEYLCVLNIIILCCVIVMHECRFIVLRRICTITGMVYIGRSICVSLIQLPVPSRHTYCGPKENMSAALIWRRVWDLLSTAGLELSHGRSLCGDLFYSGHTIILTVCYLGTLRYASRYRALGRLSTCMSMCALIGILIARKHYTVDILVSSLITSRLFHSYHLYTEYRCSQTMWPAYRTHYNATLSLVWPFRSFYDFIEGDLNVPVRNSYTRIQWGALKRLRL